MLLVISRAKAQKEHVFLGIDVSGAKGASEKAIELRRSPLAFASHVARLPNHLSLILPSSKSCKPWCRAGRK